MPLCNQAETCDDYEKVNGRGCYCNACFDHTHQNTLAPQTEQAEASNLNAGLYGRNPAEARAEILDRMKHFYMQTDGTYKWPDSAEGDLLKMVYGLLAV